MEPSWRWCSGVRNLFGLRTSRVLIVDDDRKDAEALVRAFAMEGMGAVVVSGEPSEMPFPESPLRGVRLAMLDMDLATGAQDDRTIVGTLLGVVGQLIAADNGPYLAIAWTSEPSLAAVFEEMVQGESFRPIKVIPLPKDQARVDAGPEYDVQKIVNSVKSALADVYPLELLDVWEQLVHDAATATVNMATNGAGDWPSQTQARLRRLMREAVPDSDDPLNGWRGLLEALNALHLDAAEAAVLLSYSQHNPLIERLTTTNVDTITAADRADLNRRLWVGPPLEIEMRAEPPYRVPSPGSVYLADQARASTGDFADQIPTAETLMSEITKAVDFKWSDPQPVTPTPLLLEITASCDFQNLKAPGLKFLVGLAVPTADLSGGRRKLLEKLVKEREPTIRALPDVNLAVPGLSGDYLLTWNARYTFTIPALRISEIRPLFRLRQSVLQDIQTWTGNRGVRPGFLQIR